MRQTVVGVFDQYTSAQQAAHTLQTTGFAESVFISEAMAGSLALPHLNHLTHLPHSTPARETSSATSPSSTGVMTHLRSFFTGLFGSDHSKRPDTSAEPKPGATLVRIEVNRNSDLDTVRKTLHNAGAVGIEELPAEALLDMPVAALIPSVTAQPTSHPTNPHATPHVGLTSLLAARLHDIAFRQDFDRRYADTLARYDEFQPAYHYGHALRGDPRYAGHAWAQLEPHAKADWEQLHPHRAWTRFQPAIRQGWELASRP